MHIPVLAAGLLCGPMCGIAVGVLSPLLSALITGMPPMAKLPFMVIELIAYGLVSGLCAKKRLNIYLSLIVTQVAGRLAYALALLCGMYVLHLNVPPVTAVWTAVVAGVPGIVVQLLLIPPMVLLLRRTGDFYGRIS